MARGGKRAAPGVLGTSCVTPGTGYGSAHTSVAPNGAPGAPGKSATGVAAGISTLRTGQ